MKRKKVISGNDNGNYITITVEIETGPNLMREESARMMDAAADEVMKLFARGIPYFSVPLVRLKVQ